MRALLRPVVAWLLISVCAAPLRAQPADVPAAPDEFAQERAANSLALFSKLLCSGVFVCGRQPQEFIDNDLQRSEAFVPEWTEGGLALPDMGLRPLYPRRWGTVEIFR